MGHLAFPSLCTWRFALELEVWQNKCDQRKRNDNCEIGDGSLEIVRLRMMAQPTQEKTKPDGRVQDDHENREHRIAPKSRSGFATKGHRANQCDLDK